MLDIEDLLGFKLEYNESEKMYELSGLPQFPDDTPQSKKIFDEFEIVIFKTKQDIKFPIKVDIIQRIKDIRYKDVKCFTFRDLYKIIKLDEHLFVNTNTFFKIHLEYEKGVCVFSIIYYTIKENGTNIIKNTDDLLEITKTHFRKKKFLKKFVENKKLNKLNCPNFLEYIPSIPLQWLEYNQNNELSYFEYFQSIENSIEYPF
jgi:hypothetical protein